MNTGKYILAIDQGTTSTRAIIFDHDGTIVSTGQVEHRQIFPRPGWVEHDPMEIKTNVEEVVGQALARAGVNRHQLVGVGLTNQRESTVVWDRATGQPVYNVIVWQDTRTAELCQRFAADAGPARFVHRTGLSLVPYVAGPRIAWILENVPGARERAERGELAFGTIDSWMLWNITGGPECGVHATDVTNASRTCLMDIHTLTWDEEICAHMGIPMSMLPTIRSNSEVYGYGHRNSLLIDTPISGMLGDQQAATFGQACFEPGMAKNTYGTGCFMLLNTGTTPIFSENGLLTTVCYQLGEDKPVYALEGSIAVTGSLVQWLRDNLGILDSSAQVEEYASQVADNGGAYFVPAFSGLFAPYWRNDARGTIVGLTRYVNRGHLCRAVLEATAYQTRDVIEAMNRESGVELTELRVDGGMTSNNLLMQFQADQLGVPVVRPQVVETTALGASYAAGIAVGYWRSEDIVANWAVDAKWTPAMPDDQRELLYRNWHKAISKSLDWVDKDVTE